MAQSAAAKTAASRLDNLPFGKGTLQCARHNAVDALVDYMVDCRGRRSRQTDAQGRAGQ